MRCLIELQLHVPMPPRRSGSALRFRSRHCVWLPGVCNLRRNKDNTLCNKKAETSIGRVGYRYGLIVLLCICRLNLKPLYRNNMFSISGEKKNDLSERGACEPNILMRCAYKFYKWRFINYKLYLNLRPAKRIKWYCIFTNLAL